MAKLGSAASSSAPARTNESHNVELADGTILQNMRDGSTREIARSRDRGISFGPVTHDCRAS